MFNFFAHVNELWPSHLTSYNPLLFSGQNHGYQARHGQAAALVVVLNFSSQLADWVGGWWQLAVLLWAISILVVVPLGVRDIRRAQREPWQDMTIETEVV